MIPAPESENFSPPKIGLVSLGCPKALVDSERIVTRLRAEGYDLASNYKEADAVIVNTCGFIDSARKESLASIEEALQENAKVIVTGCLGVENKIIHERFPNLLSISGPADFSAVMNAVHQAVPRPEPPYSALIPPAGLKLTPRHYAYVKISEGCNNRCSFCIIPRLRGPLVSRPLPEVMQEAENLVQAGVRELLIVSQDTSAYGLDARHPLDDWRGKPTRRHILDLAQALSELGVWVRLHYLYPYPFVDRLLPLMNREGLLPYLDIPFQHASPSVLKAMRRPASQEKTLERIHRWREACPDLVLRSTFIVGFPGENESDFCSLLDWLEEAELDRVGCYAFEAVEGASANALPGAVPEPVKQERYHRFMQKAKEISRKRLKRFPGETLRVLLDEVEGQVAHGRSWADAPEIDGKVVINLADRRGVRAGEFLDVQVVKSDNYDLYAEVC